MIRGIAVCRHFAEEARAALDAEGLSHLEVVPIQGGCDGAAPGGGGRALEAGLVPVCGDCVGLPGPGLGLETCFALLADPARVDGLLAEGRHLLTPSMVRDWERAKADLGLPPEELRRFFAESTSGFHVFDCGLSPLAEAELEPLREATGLPVAREGAGLGFFRSALRRALAPAGASAEAKRLSEYAMVFDVMSRLADLDTEDQAIEEIAQLFLMLCAPRRVVLDLAPLGGKPGRRVVLPPGEEGPAGGTEAGFSLGLAHGAVRLGWLRVDGLALPERKAHYQHLGTLLAPMLALTLASLRARDRLLAAIVDSSDDAILSKTLDGTITSWNSAAARIFGYEAAEVLGRPMTLLIPADRAGEEERILERIRRGEPVEHFETVRLRKDGGLVHVSVSISPLRDGSGAVVGASKIARDITERRKAEEVQRRLEAEVHQAQKLESVGLLAGGVAHDMNNILGAIQAVTQTLRLVHGGNPALDRPLETVEKASLRGRDLVKTLTAFVRKDLREPECIDVNGLATEVRDLLRRTTLQRIDLRLDLAEGLPAVRGERGPLTSAVLNLCLNAVDAMPGGGTLTLETRAAGQEVALAVRDTGTGMSPAVRERALEPFFTTKPVGKGTGLGLAMVYSTVKAHGGRFSLESEEGRGTTVTLTFPGQAPAAAPAPGGEVGLREERSLRILLVDDDDLIRDSVPSLLATLGHRVAVAAGGREALARLEAGEAADLVILDMNMPGMNGAETLRAIRPLRPDLPVLLATGHLDEDMAGLLATDPRARTLDKPFRREDLAARIRELLG